MTTETLPPEGLLPTVWQIYNYAVGKLNQRDPARCEAILRDAAHTAAEHMKQRLKSMFEASGFRRGPPAYRREFYGVKTQMEPQAGLWQAQIEEYPQSFRRDATDAYKLGAYLPRWVEDAVAAMEESR